MKKKTGFQGRRKERERENEKPADSHHHYHDPRAGARGNNGSDGVEEEAAKDKTWRRGEREKIPFAAGSICFALALSLIVMHSPS